MRRRNLAGDLNYYENGDRILDFSTSAQEDTRFVKLFGRYLGLLKKKKGCTIH